MHSILDISKKYNIDAHVIKVDDIVVENRVYLKCAYGCKDFGKRLNCPPNIISIDEFRKILKEYEKALILIEKCNISENSDINDSWDILRKESFKKMIQIEKAAFNQGYHFAHLLRAGSCNECEKCEDICKKPHLRRFSPESVGINLTKTLKNISIEIDYKDTNKINIIGILLLY
ncbi:Predicted metal-binding protein [Alkalithermobacter thermoalcaliphilus JW-YL-7 = DSM 7308]|uniref:Predicted metal-binding protein n=1 Tax=Alkalithermobacter thermoalcaliphilus JW-YL-7 = DSM 7308 TaxID=1121328 RepID=A0A150FRC5_CLOPD|nr:Protein of unknown function DUF2284, metal-binding protein [[Clostridium] paradoxum JW-YL-7 = DSM 7308]SHK43924.1 Predicted metal-binding protein [[Clostridium] paradoxum JW-YL-7 = DSM 7308]